MQRDPVSKNTETRKQTEKKIRLPNVRPNKGSEAVRGKPGGTMGLQGSKSSTGREVRAPGYRVPQQ